MSFQEWLKAVNKEVVKITEGQIGLFDLADWCSRDAFDDGLDPKEAALEAIQHDDLGGEFLANIGLV